MSACLLAHVNTSGIHVPLWIVSSHQAVGWGQDPEFPNQEGSFFGNVFMLGAHGTDPTKAPMYYCTGAKYNVNAPTGRIGSTQTNPPYVNPWGATGACGGTVSRCTAADYPFQADGFKTVQRLEQRRDRVAPVDPRHQHVDGRLGRHRQGLQLALAPPQ